MIRAVLVDDEPQSCKSLAIKLKAIADDIHIVNSLHHPEKAIPVILKTRPDVVFLDIEMPGMNGFQMLEKMEGFDFEVIFITAYSEYMLTALHLGALDYLLKPVDPEELNHVLNRLRKRLLSQHTLHANEQQPEQETMLKQHPGNKRLALTTLQGITFLKISEIIRVEALSNYSTFYLVNKQKMVVSKTLKAFEPVLCPPSFFRVNRSCIINTEYVIRYKHDDGGMLELQDGSHVGVGPYRKNELVELIARI